MAWAFPQFSRGRVGAAGDYLAHGPVPGFDPDADDAQWDSAFNVVTNWRASHSWPLLSTRVTLGTRAQRVSHGALVTQRLKRLTTIVHKLGRHSRMKLSQMQDVGGCRAVMPSVSQAEALAKVYQRAEKRRRPEQSECIETYDYLNNPKRDGYRGVHFVYKYRSREARYASHFGLRIEIQIRSRLQHAWATALEAVDLFTRQALKSNLGEERWQRFFLLMGAAVARKEKRAVPPNTPARPADLRDELRALAHELHVENTFAAYGDVAVRVITEGPAHGGEFLLSLDVDAREIELRHYSQADIHKATEDYNDLEKQILTKGLKRQAVLVSAANLYSLSAGYAGFYAHTRPFLELLREATA